MINSSTKTIIATTTNTTTTNTPSPTNFNNVANNSHSTASCKTNQFLNSDSNIIGNTETTTSPTAVTSSTTPTNTISSISPTINTSSSVDNNVVNGSSSIKSESVTSNAGDSAIVNNYQNNDTNSRTNNAIDNLSRTNLYIKGLQPNTSDQNLYDMCSRFGPILSTKAIQDKISGLCRGYGFVEFTTPEVAEVAVKELTKSGIQAQMARISPIYPSHHSNHHNRHHHHHHNNHQHHHYQQQHHNSHHNNGNSSNSGNNNHSGRQQHNQSSSSNNDADPTNLYIANLPPNMSEQELENLLSTYGPVISTRILRDEDNVPRGVGFARMETRDKCEQIIEQLNGQPYKGWKEPLLVKFADGGLRKRLHHNIHNQYHQHHNNNLQHLKVHQDDSRWRDSSNTSDPSSVSNFDRQGNISHSNHLTDLAMINALGYPRMQPGYPPTIAASSAYPTPLGPPNSAPQWFHSNGQPFVIPQQMIQTAGLDPSSQAAALHYSHIPQLASQMQSLQIAHPGNPVGGYLPPQHQWAGMWSHPVAPQASMRLPTSVPQAAQAQPQPTLSQQSPQPTAMQQTQPTIPQQANLATDNKL